MPYVMSIGEVITRLNDYLDDPGNMVTMLTELRDTTTVTRVSQLSFFSLANFPTQTELDAVVAHVEKDWFGWNPGTSVQKPFQPNNPNKTGWWTAWHGNADTITRETLTRALEVGLGVPHGSKTITPARHWPLLLTWTCGAPLFQGWVVWRSAKSNPANGFVLCSFTTPGSGDSLYGTPHHPAPRPTGGGYQDPAKDVGNRGMWVIGDDVTDIRMPDASWRNDVTGDLPDWTGAFIHTHENANKSGLAVVSPSEDDGGINPTGPGT